MMQWAGKAESVQGAHGHHQTNRDRGSEIQEPRQIRAVEKKRARARLLLVRQLEAVLEIAF
jgi:hypothetical protein